MLEDLRCLCSIVGGAMPLGLGDAEISNEVHYAMVVKLRQQCLG